MSAGQQTFMLGLLDQKEENNLELGSGCIMNGLVGDQKVLFVHYLYDGLSKKSTKRFF